MNREHPVPFWCEPITVLDEATRNFVDEPRGLCRLLVGRTGKRGRELSPKTLFCGKRPYVEAMVEAMNRVHHGFAADPRGESRE